MGTRRLGRLGRLGLGLFCLCLCLWSLGVWSWCILRLCRLWQCQWLCLWRLRMRRMRRLRWNWLRGRLCSRMFGLRHVGGRLGRRLDRRWPGRLGWLRQ